MYVFCDIMYTHDIYTHISIIICIHKCAFKLISYNVYTYMYTYIQTLSEYQNTQVTAEQGILWGGYD